MYSSVARDRLMTVLRAISDPTTPNRSAEASSAEDELTTWSSYRWVDLLIALPTDAQGFQGQFERSWSAVIDDLDRWRIAFQQRPAPTRQRLDSTFGFLGLLLITLVSLRHSDDWRHPRRPAGSAGTSRQVNHDCALLCVPLVAEPAVRRAIEASYHPDSWLPYQESGGASVGVATRAEWNGIDFDSLAFHRHGTTSFILTGVPIGAAQGKRRPLVLKCLIYPFLKVPTIARATQEYHSTYGMPSRDLRHVVGVWASSASWILMDYVPGETLAEHLDRLRHGPTGSTGSTGAGRPRPRPSEPPGGEIQIDLLGRLGRELFVAMADLEQAGLPHCDLSPSNIIVTRGGAGDRPSFMLIDLGANYLYTQSVPGMEGPDAGYVAPEVKAGARSTSRADLYSVGQLLITISGAPRGSDASVPDPFYAETPVMARFLEDLIDGDPHSRLLIFRPDRTRPLYPQLSDIFEEELEAMRAIREQRSGPGGPRWLAGPLGLVTPLAGAPGRQWRMWRIRRSQGLYQSPRRGMYARWLLAASWLSATAWYVAVTIVVTWWLRDLEWEWGNQAIVVLQRVTDTPPDRFPFLDSMRAEDYEIPDLAENLPVRMVSLSFLLVGARYYQNLFAGLTPLVAGLRQGWLSLLAVLAEAHMRLFAVLAFLLVMPPTLVQGRWWPAFTAIGVLLVFSCNWCCLSFARLALRRAKLRGLSTVPAGRIPGLEAFSGWTPSAAFYAGAVWSIGTLIYLGFARDVYVYAGAVTAINVVLFYLIKCSGQSAADVRTGLGRAFLAAERLRYAAEAEPEQRVPRQPARRGPGRGPEHRQDDRAHPPDPVRS